jgi:hypothetical protein
LAEAAFTQAPSPAMPPSRSYRRRRILDVKPGTYVLLSTEITAAAINATIDQSTGNPNPSLRFTVSVSDVFAFARVPLTA